MSARLKKLRAMSAAEIGSRLGYGAFLAVEAGRHRRGDLTRADRLVRALRREINPAAPLDAILALRRRAGVRFFPGLSSRNEMHELFAAAYATERLSARRHADAALRHEFEFFGRRFQYGRSIDWHADPPTGRRWPASYHREVPVHRGDIGYGDVKYVWELNRHQFMIDLGKAQYLFADQTAGGELVDLVRDWMAHNPYGTGVSWACALEPAFRAWSWMWAYNFALEAGPLRLEDHLQWLAGFHDHGHFLHRHLEYYSSPFNHLIGEAATLYALGVLFPEFREAGAWRRRGRRVLESRLGSQFYADGGSVEQSTFYHHATLGFYILAALLGRQNAEEFSPAVWSAIERGIEFSMQMMQPDGSIPRIGGADDGKPIRLEHLPFWDFRSYQAVGAVLFSRPEFKFTAGRFHEDALWLLGPEGLRQFERLESRPPADASRRLDGSGYFVLRSDWSKTADYVCFDCGEQAASARTDDVPSSVHGHADCLSVIVWLRGKPVFVDAGFFTYNGEKAWQDFFRETAAHNTARLDGRNQAVHLDKMAWTHTFRPLPELWAATGTDAYASGAHDGYLRGPDGMVHRRTVWLRPGGGYLLIYDEFTGRGRHALELNYQCAPRRAVMTDSRLLLDDEVELAWFGSQPVMPQLSEGGPRPEGGWVALSLGVLVPAARLTLQSVAAGPRSAFLTVVADRSLMGARQTRVRWAVPEDVGSGPLMIDGPDFVDAIVAEQVAPSGRGFRTDARLAVWRLGGGTTHGSRIGGTFASVDAEAKGLVPAMAVQRSHG